MKFLLDYIKRYKFVYFSICVVLIIGVAAGGIILLKSSSDNKEEISKYILENVVALNKQGIDKNKLFITSVSENIKFMLVLYLLGCTVIAGCTVYVFILYKGFVLGYTSMAIILAYGLKNSFKYLLTTVILHNVIYLPFAFLLALSGIRLYREIMKRSYNFTSSFLRHTVILLICLAFSIISSGIEAYFSTIIFEIL